MSTRRSKATAGLVMLLAAGVVVGVAQAAPGGGEPPSAVGGGSEGVPRAQQRANDEAMLQRLASQAPDEIATTPNIPCRTHEAANDQPRVEAADKVVVVFACKVTGPAGEAVGRSQDRKSRGGGVELRLVDALKELAEGPTADERAQGYEAVTGPTVLPESVSLKGGVATIDYPQSLASVPALGGSQGSEDFLYSVRSTAFQFPAVRSIQITMGNSCDAFWNLVQRECQIVERGKK